jgi:hypothetical protein
VGSIKTIAEFHSESETIKKNAKKYGKDFSTFIVAWQKFSANKFYLDTFVSNLFNGFEIISHGKNKYKNLESLYT